MKDIFFKSSEHQRRFLDAVVEIHKTYDGGKIDPEYGAALYILTSSFDLWRKVKQFVDQEGIDLDAIEHIGFSGGQSVLVALAGNLFNDRQGSNASPVEIATRLDMDNFYVALTALMLRRSGAHLSDFQ